MTATVGAHGENTDVRITPNFNFSQIAPRLAKFLFLLFLALQSQLPKEFRILSCDISHGDHVIYAMHSFLNDELCADNRNSKHKLTIVYEF